MNDTEENGGTGSEDQDAQTAPDTPVPQPSHVVEPDDALDEITLDQLAGRM